MYLVGLTGGIATGKSTASRIFSSLGVPVIDADVVARQVVLPGKRAWKRIRDTFGDDVFNSDRSLDRAALGNIIFGNEDKRKQLNRITHPEIFRAICWEIIINFFKGHKFVILDLPLLFESGMWGKYLKYIIVVSCTDEIQLERLVKRNDLTEEEARKRIKSQMPLAEKRPLADFIIENSGSEEDTREQIVWVYEDLMQNNAYFKIRLIIITSLALVTGGISLLLTYAIHSIFS